MKKYISFFLATFALSLALGLTFHSMKMAHQKQESLLKSYDMPDFGFQQENGKLFTRDSLAKNKGTLVLHIAPSCGGCWAQLTELQKLKKVVNPLQILLVSSADWEELRKLKQWIATQTQWEVTIVQDTHDNFAQSFGTRAIPAVFCYNQQWLLQEHFKGETKASVLYPSLSQLQNPQVVSSYRTHATTSILSP